MPDPLDKIRRDKPRPAAPSKSAGVKGTERTSDTPETGGAAEPAFDDILRSVTGTPGEKQLGILFREIRSLSEKLAHRRLLEDLEAYRNKVSQFLRIYVNEVLDVKIAKGRSGAYRRKQMLVIKRIDVELEELSKFVLGGAPDFKILAELGTIEGLLMDLYK